MTTEREEFEKIMVSFTSPDGDYFSANIGSADNIDELWSWHQQSLERAVREAQEQLLNWFYYSVVGYPEAKQYLMIKAKTVEIDYNSSQQSQVNNKK